MTRVLLAVGSLFVLAAALLGYWVLRRLPHSPEFTDDTPFTPLTDPYCAALWQRAAA